MEKLLFKKIKEYQTIIIHRHSRPDLDALGSQLGLAYVLKEAYPDKKIYVVGDTSKKYNFIGSMDNINDDEYNNALAIICDVAVSAMVSDDRYKLAKEVFVIDHHRNASDITENHLCNTSCVACCEYLTNLLLENGYIINSEAATCFYGGLVTDSGRFMYGEALANTFMTASRLIEFGANPKYIYDNIYVETLADSKMKAFFANRYEIKNGVAYLKNTKEIMDMYPDKEFNDISRGMLSVMSGILEISIWCNFTYDSNKDAVVCEFRSRSIPIVDVAKKYGGGGHLLACGCTIPDFDVADKIIDEFISLINKENA